jgi:hypothetical protein
VKPATLSQARAAKAKVAELMKGSDAVNGVGIARQGAGYAVKLNLVRATKTDALPSAVDGVPVKVEVVGEITKRSKKQPSRRAAAPARGRSRAV